jgi:hypothetical protein
MVIDTSALLAILLDDGVPQSVFPLLKQGLMGFASGSSPH